jgi:hypothetical protein
LREHVLQSGTDRLDLGPRHQRVHDRFQGFPLRSIRRPEQRGEESSESILNVLPLKHGAAHLLQEIVPLGLT